MNKLINITEPNLNNLVKEVLNKLEWNNLNESRTSVYRPLINAIYKVAQPWTSHTFHDNDWSNLHHFIDNIEQVPGVLEVNVSCKDGGYTQHDGMYTKRYDLDIATEFDQESGYNGLTGYINCYLCGTMENPFERYDMSIQLWVNKEVRDAIR